MCKIKLSYLFQIGTGRVMSGTIYITCTYQAVKQHQKMKQQLRTSQLGNKIEDTTGSIDLPFTVPV